MKRPEHPLIVALVERYAQQTSLEAHELWAYLDRRKVPPPTVRASLVDAFYPLVRPDDFLPLTSAPNDAQYRYMESTEMVKTVAGRPLESNHPFARWLRAQHMTVADWARNHTNPGTGKPYTRERVKAWIAEGAGARPIPRHAADMIARESDGAVKANARAWKNGIRE
jgi:hypothetical protein